MVVVRVDNGGGVSETLKVDEPTFKEIHGGSLAHG